MKLTEGRFKQIIREEARRVLREGDDRPVLYTGIVLDPDEVDRLRGMIDELKFGDDIEDWQTSNIASHGNEQLNHHMTLSPGALKPDNPVRDMLDEEFELVVTGWGVDPSLGVAAWRVEAPDGVPVKTGNPHITAALADSGVKPFLASKIKEWKSVEPFTVMGTLREVRER